MPYTYDTLDHSFTLTGLVADTTYYYTIMTCGAYLCNDDINTLYSFHTPKSASTSISTTVTSTGTLYLSGATATGMVFTGSTGSGRIILTNTGNTVSVSIPTSGLIISASGVWDGSLEAPSVETGSHTINLTGGSVAVYVIHRVGNNSTPLALSGQLATISIAITAADGYSVAVYRSDAI